jgi:hypothetical protein
MDSLQKEKLKNTETINQLTLQNQEQSQEILTLKQEVDMKGDDIK